MSPGLLSPRLRASLSLAALAAAQAVVPAAQAQTLGQVVADLLDLDQRVTLDAGRITVLDATVNQNGVAIDVLKTQNQAIGSDLAGVGGRVDAVAGTVGTLVGRVDGTVAAVGDVAVKATANAAAIADVSGKLDTTVAAVADVTAKASANVAAIANVAAKVDANVAGLVSVGAKVDANAAAVAGVAAKVDANVAAVADMDAKVDANVAAVANVNARVDANVAALVDLDTQVAANTTAITNIDARVTNNTSAIANVDARVTNIDARVTTNTAAITNLDARVTVNEQAVTTLAADVDAGRVGLVRQATPDADITVGARSGGSVVNVAGTAGDRRISGVAAGVADDDAATVGQVAAASRTSVAAANAYTDASSQATLAAANTYTDDAVGRMRQSTEGQMRQMIASNNVGLKRDMSALAAGSNALAGLPQAFIPGRGMAGVSIGGSRGQTAFAAGLSKAFTGEHAPVLRAGAAVDTRRGDLSYNASVGFHF